MRLFLEWLADQRKRGMPEKKIEAFLEIDHSTLWRIEKRGKQPLDETKARIARKTRGAVPVASWYAPYNLTPKELGKATKEGAKND